MSRLASARYASSTIAAVALLAGCGGSQPLIGAPGAIPQSRAIATHAARGGSWMLPEAKSGDLLYVSDDNQSRVYVFSYPTGTLVGTLMGFQYPAGECVDKGGDVWIVNSSPAEVIEYAHGGTTPIATLSDAGQAPLGCSVDPTSGNLALSNEGGTVEVFAAAQGTPTSYTDSDIPNFYYCAYDQAGNLFVTGKSSSENLIAELTNGSAAMQSVTLSEQIDAGSVQWDGTYLAIDDLAGGSRGPTKIDRVHVSGTTGTVVGSTLLENKKNRKSGSGVQYWVTGSTIIGPEPSRHGILRLVEFWKYPQGGKSTESLNITGASGLWGTTLSVASRH